MANYTLSSEQYYSFTAVIRETKYLDACFEVIEDEEESVFIKLEIISNSGVEELIVPPSVKLNKGDKLRLFFEKYISDYSQPNSFLERGLNKIDMPDIIKVVKDNGKVSTYFPFQ